MRSSPPSRELSCPRWEGRAVWRRPGELSEGRWADRERTRLRQEVGLIWLEWWDPRISVALLSLIGRGEPGVGGIFRPPDGGEGADCDADEKFAGDDDTHRPTLHDYDLADNFANMRHETSSTIQPALPLVPSLDRKRPPALQTSLKDAYEI